MFGISFKAHSLSLNSRSLLLLFHYLCQNRDIFVCKKCLKIVRNFTTKGWLVFYKLIDFDSKGLLTINSMPKLWMKISSGSYFVEDDLLRKVVSSLTKNINLGKCCDEEKKVEEKWDFICVSNLSTLCVLYTCKNV